jgi:hypothetical protein
VSYVFVLRDLGFSINDWQITALHTYEPQAELAYSCGEIVK